MTVTVTGLRGRAALVAAGTGLALAGSTVPATPAAAEDGASIAGLPPVVYDAHRGGGMETRENSLSGLDYALANRTVDVIDLDTRMLADGTVVLMHDTRVDRASASTGPVSSFTRASWRDVMLDIGSWLDPLPPPEPAPTLAQALRRVGGRVVLTIEAKDIAAVDKIATIVRRRGLVGSVFINTNSPRTARYISSLGLHSHLWRSAEQMETDDPTRFAPYVDLLDIDIDATTADFAKFVTSGAERVWAHTITTRRERDRALAQGATGIITDAPYYLKNPDTPYPRVPTLVRVSRGPAPTQVSDRANAEVVLRGESGPTIPGIEPYVKGRSVSATSTASTRRGVSILRLDTVGARAGRGPVRVKVDRGGEGPKGERRWGAGSVTMPLRLAKEDLQMVTSTRVRGTRVKVRVRLLDSAAPGYTGRRHETGRRRTVAGLGRARLTAVLSRAGTVVDRVEVAGADTGADQGDGAGVVRPRLDAPGPGVYDVRVTQRGPTYRTLSRTHRVTIG